MIDFSKNQYKELWFRHPVLGDASFDTFERDHTNPLHKGSYPYEWPVNCSLFRDTVSGNLYAYVSQYSRGYWNTPIRCIAYRSQDQRASWEYIGVVLEGTFDQFDCKDGKQGCAADIGVVYYQGEYHSVFGWTTYDNREGGLAHAKSRSPEGPFVISPVPVHHDLQQDILLGKYRRAYASFLIKRQNDWLVLAMMSTPHNAGGTWAFVAMTADKPDGPYSPPRFILYPQSRHYHPPTLEYLAPFETDGYIYAPFSSVALNRSFQVIYRAKKELAHFPDAWEIFKHGSLWHAEDIECERQGIWGQTFAGLPEDNGRFRVLYPSKTLNDEGTVNQAYCWWNRIDAKDGFFLTAPNGKSITFLKRDFNEFELHAEVASNRAKTIIWAYRAPLGPDSSTADATVHPFSLRDMVYLEMKEGIWKLAAVDENGMETVLTSECYVYCRTDTDRIEVSYRKEYTRIVINGIQDWEGTLDVKRGRVGLLAQKGDYLTINCFLLDTEGMPCCLNYLYTEGLIGAGEYVEIAGNTDCTDEGWIPERIGLWEKRNGNIYRYGVGYESCSSGSIVKWNYLGSDFGIWSPQGPHLGKARIFLDGCDIGIVMMQSQRIEPSHPVYKSGGIPYGYHAVVMEVLEGTVVCDSFEFYA